MVVLQVRFRASLCDMDTVQDSFKTLARQNITKLHVRPAKTPISLGIYT